eukprot:COSAG01_NODE_4269_length_5195_cov_11.029435_3_plen_175_part_00
MQFAIHLANHWLAVVLVVATSMRYAAATCHAQNLRGVLDIVPHRNVLAVHLVLCTVVLYRIVAHHRPAGQVRHLVARVPADKDIVRVVTCEPELLAMLPMFRDTCHSAHRESAVQVTVCLGRAVQHVPPIAGRRAATVPKLYGPPCLAAHVDLCVRYCDECLGHNALPVCNGGG